MFVNEAVPSAALDPDFGSWARDLALREVTRVLTETRRPWMVATDQLYLGHRMQRWAGVVETAVAMDRHVVNPMLDDRFISIAECLDPRDKRNSRFLSRLQLELDPELGSYPLEGRPPPLAYAHHSLRSSAQLTASTLRKLRGKAVQRLRRESRPPAGGELLAQKVVAHWREHPSLLEPVAGRDVFDAVWLDAMVDGRHEPPPSAVALLVNLLAALGPSGVVCPTTPPGASSGTRPHG
jgi:asparagine synthase (glutamine-hydrolysing)